MTADDQAIVKASLAGKRGAFETLVREHQKLVWHVIARMVPLADDVRDLSQDTFIRVHQNLRQFRGECRLSTWIGQIAFSVAARHLRRHRLDVYESIDSASANVDDLGSTESDDMEQVFDRTLALATLQRHIAMLAPVQRVVLSLYYLEERDLDDIARITALPIGTLKSHLFRARQQLRKALEPAQENAYV
jgi:RNA polymerase sigma factor (sigma-70 family)